MAEESQQNVARFAWSKAKHDAAELLALDELTDEEIAQKCETTRKTLWVWKKNPIFKARVAELKEELGDAARRHAVGHRSRRLRWLNDRIERMHRVIRDRAADPSMQEVPGGSTGLIVRTIKGLGSGENFTLVSEYEVDTALLAELRAHEKQAAQEAGQWSDKVSHGGTVSYEHHFPDLDQLTPDELLRLYQEQIGPSAEDR